ncbi:hypothetical protein HPB50_019204 [Hyalomma asiaticum]|uniref:Uncharacterized protein n=1 Tax=Hyalomma asiaticum TaxID=266040 RepID=A0ACB7TK95_HYAAI|nr:hypothetical protein HPB50_019204 [Hyalomma asiaticum]
MPTYAKPKTFTRNVDAHCEVNMRNETYRVEWPSTVPEITVELPPNFPGGRPFYTLRAVVVPLALLEAASEVPPKLARTLPLPQYGLVSAKARTTSKFLPHQLAPFAVNAFTGDVTLTDALRPNGRNRNDVSALGGCYKRQLGPDERILNRT